MNPLVTIVVPVKDTPGVILKECLESIVTQSYTNIEIICVDDGSKSIETKEILEDYEKTNSKVFVIHKEVSEGAGEARNNGMDSASGKYIIFIDSDDVILSEFIRRLVDGIVVDTSDVCISGFTTFCDDEYGRTILNKNTTCKKQEVVFEELLLKVSTCPWNKMCSLEYLKNNHIRFQNLPSDNDVYFSIMTMLNTDKISYIESSDYYYRTRNSFQISAKRNPICFLNAIEYSLNDILKRDTCINNSEQIIYTYFVYTALDEIVQNQEDNRYMDYYDACSHFLRKMKWTSSHKRTRILIERWINESFQSRWFNLINDYFSQINGSKELLIKEVKKYKEVFIWGMGKRAKSFERFAIENKIRIAGICDSKMDDDNRIDEFGIRVYLPQEVLKCKGLIVASNHSVYRYLTNLDNVCFSLMDLEDYCPL